MKIQFEIKNRQVFFAVIFISFITLLTLAIAITAVNPGHTSNDVIVSISGTEKTLQSAIDDGSFGSGSRTAIFTSSGTFTAPAGVTKVYLTMVGGGGGGGAGATGCGAGSGSVGTGGGGGGGGSITNLYPFTVTPGSNYAITIGAGGTGGTSGNGGTVGGTTSFGTISAAGGYPGGVGIGNCADLPGSGGGSPSNINGIGSTGGKYTVASGNGAAGISRSSGGGGGGGGGTLLGNGGNGGAGGTSNGMVGGTGGVGISGGGGGGGGGGYGYIVAGGTGGGGASGRVIIMY